MDATARKQGWTRRRFVGGALPVIAVLGGCATGIRDAGPAASRTIPFGLWTGVAGADFGAPVDVVHGSRRIRGPIDWTHPVTSQRLRVYERRNEDPEGAKIQLFTLREDGSALARVFDRRPGQSDRVFVDDAFFPMGLWEDDERRRYRMVEHQDGQARERVATLRIRELSYDYDGVSGSLKYDWRLTDPADGKVFDERFIYSPGVGFAKFINRMD